MHFDIIIFCGKTISIGLVQYDTAEYQMSIAYLVFRSWFIAILRQKKRMGITGKVIFFFDARLSAEIENVVYPLIYAIIIPNFKEIVANLF